MKKIVVVSPTMWDRKQLEACRDGWAGRHQVELAEPSDDDWPWDFDVLSYLEELAERYRGRFDGVTSSSDYPGATLAAALATRFGLSGSDPRNVIRCSHKYYSRIAQREIVPEATPWFRLVDPKSPEASASDLEFPCYIKPVKGAFSVMSGRIDAPRDLVSFLSRPATGEFLKYYILVFNRLVAGLTDFELDGGYFIAEELLHGEQATVEGYEHDGEVRLLGIVDSLRHPDTGSFLRFDYPSSLAAAVQERMAAIVRRLVAHLELRNTVFNVEMIYEPASERISIVEVNPRMCGQFADLYRKVDGASGYEVALALAAGEPPPVRRGEGSFRVASSVPLRIFEPARVERAPTASEIEEVERAFAGTLVWNEYATGDDLSDFDTVEDGKSARYAVVNLGASDRAALGRKLDQVVHRLGHRFQPLSGEEA